MLATKGDSQIATDASAVYQRSSKPAKAQGGRKTDPTPFSVEAGSNGQGCKSQIAKRFGMRQGGRTVREINLRLL